MSQVYYFWGADFVILTTPGAFLPTNEVSKILSSKQILCYYSIPILLRNNKFGMLQVLPGSRL